MTDRIVLFWHRRDLRLSDNLGLMAARQRSQKLVGVFCLDPKILEGGEAAPACVAYMVGCLRELQRAYVAAGSELLILHADPCEGIPALAVALGAVAVFWNRDGEPYALGRDRTVEATLQTAGIQAESVWDQLLHAPGEIFTGAGKPYTVYTPFWRNWSNQAKALPAPPLRQATGLTEIEREQAEQVGAIALPTARDLGFIWDNELILQPGTDAAREQLDWFCDRALSEYAEQRNFPAQPGTSQLSPALRFGTLGIREVWAASREAWALSRSDDSRRNIQIWQQELAWREFYHHVLYFFPELATGAYRPAMKSFPWDDNLEYFQAWCAGKTGYPIVDAAMRQLNQSGWMHNRCRMIVASFLTKNLLINWQWGERYFMQNLIDGELAANNGGWQWSASSGMDPKPLRIFNPFSQSQKFDPEAEYIRTWLPELSSIDTAALVTGEILPLERQACAYPAPIVDRKQQQQEFKRRYQEQKSQTAT